MLKHLAALMPLFIAACDAGSPMPPPSSPHRGAPTEQPIYDRLHDSEGSVAGLDGFSLSRKPDQTRCGGVAIVVTRPQHVAKDDTALAALFELEFPTELAFPADDKERKEHSMREVEHFIDQLVQTGEAARRPFEDMVTTTDSVTKVVAAARLAQIDTRIASVIARAEIPDDARTGADAAAKSAAFCNTLAQASERIEARAESSRSLCAREAKTVNGGWWDTICSEP